MANPVRAALKYSRGTVTRAVDGNVTQRARSGGALFRPKTVVRITGKDGQTVSRTVIGGGLTEAGKNTSAIVSAGGAAGAAQLHRQHYTPRKQTRTVNVKVRKGLGVEVADSAFGEVSKAFGVGALGAARRMASVGMVKPMSAIKPTQAISSPKAWKAAQVKTGGAQSFGMQPKAPKPFGARPPGQISPTTILPQRKPGLRLRLNPFGNRRNR